MKTKLISLLFILLSVNMLAQKKKVIVKKGATTVKKTTPLKAPLISSAFLGKNIDDVTYTLDQKFSELGFTTMEVNDSKDFFYTDTYVKTDDVYHNYREIILDNGSIYITSDNELKVLHLDYNCEDIDSLKANKLLILFNINNKQLIEKRGGKRVFKLGKNEFAEVYNYDTSISIKVLQAENYSIPLQDIVFNGLTCHSHFENFQTSIIKTLERNNLKLLWKEKRSVLNDNEYNFINYTDNYTFTDGITLQFELNKYNKKSVYIYASSPITMLKLERAFDLSKWDYRYKASNSEQKYYKNNNLLLEFNKDENYIGIILIPSEFEIDEQYLYGDKLSVSTLEFIYKNFTGDDLQKYLIDHYLISYNKDNDGKITFNHNNSFFAKLNDDAVLAGIGSAEGFKNYGYKYLIDTNNSNINEQFKNDAKNLELISEDFNMADSNYKIRTQFYDKATYTAMITRDKVQQDIKKQQEEAVQLAEQQREAERIQQEIIREREKAARNAELTESINKTTNALMDLLKK